MVGFQQLSNDARDTRARHAALFQLNAVTQTRFGLEVKRRYPSDLSHPSQVLGLNRQRKQPANQPRNPDWQEWPETNFPSFLAGLLADPSITANAIEASDELRNLLGEAGHQHAIAAATAVNRKRARQVRSVGAAVGAASKEALGKVVGEWDTGGDKVAPTVGKRKAPGKAVLVALGKSRRNSGEFEREYAGEVVIGGTILLFANCAATRNALVSLLKRTGTVMTCYDDFAYDNLVPPFTGSGSARPQPIAMDSPSLTSNAIIPLRARSSTITHPPVCVS